MLDFKFMGNKDYIDFIPALALVEAGLNAFHRIMYEDRYYLHRVISKLNQIDINPN